MKNYLSENKELMQEWDFERNIDLNPTKLTYGSNKKVWWICSKCGHRWQTSISHRALSGSGCTNCYWHKRSKYKDNNILKTHPEIAKDWDKTKNKNLTPDLFTKNSRKEVWWKCSKCGNEEFKNIRSYNGCKKCKKEKYLAEHNLSLTYPELLKEWNYEKNGKITPDKVMYSSHEKVWWKCSKCGYEWLARINNRAIGNRRCPCCSNKIAVKGINDLATTHPELAKEWHPTKNGTLTPNNVTYGYGKKVWWICPNKHEYQATVNKRTSRSGTNCPICNSGRQTSFAEQAFYFYIKQLYPDAINRYTADFLGQMELDIFIPSINLAIEYDGEAWHKKDKIKRETKKYQLCKSKQIKLIRLREEMPEIGVEIADQIFSTKNLYEHENLNQMIQTILTRIDFVTGNWMLQRPIDVNIKRDKFKILEYRMPIKTHSFADKFPDIAKEWHPTKNGNLKPNMFKSGSEHKIWWLCPTCGNEYKSAIGRRTDKKHPTGCPICGFEKVLNSTRKKVNMIDIKTNKIIKTFISLSEAGRQMNINSSNISMVCKGQRNQAGGYYWRYAEHE